MATIHNVKLVHCVQSAGGLNLRPTWCPSRYAIAPVCSLMMELEENCQMKSRMGKNVTANSYKGLYMYFGGEGAAP